MSKPEVDSYILHESEAYIIACKPAGLPSVPDQSGSENLQDILSKQSRKKLHALTRLDRPVSGIVIYTTSPHATAQLQQTMHDNGLEKSYIAIVEGQVEQDEQDLTQYLRKAKGNKTIVTQAKNGKKSQLSFSVLTKLDNYSVLLVLPITGRFHQIRAQLAHIGHPIKGDVKYGARRGNRDRSIHLHAYQVKMLDPFTAERVTFTCPLPGQETLWEEASKSLQAKG